MMVIRSGGQSGADLAGWKAAKASGLPTTGWMPSGFLTEDGPRPEYGPTYGATETPSTDYRQRTAWNVRDSDATLVFRSARAATHRGCDLTMRACGELKKPCMVIHVWSTPDSIPTTAKLAGLIVAKGFRVVNIAGSRGSADPPVDGRPGSGIENFVFSYLLDVFTLIKGAT